MEGNTAIIAFNDDGSITVKFGVDMKADIVIRSLEDLMERLDSAMFQTLINHKVHAANPNTKEAIEWGASLTLKDIGKYYK